MGFKGRQISLSEMDRRSLEPLFLSKVERSDGCWTWIGGKSRGGYGKVQFNKRTFVAHRVAHAIWIGDVPAGLLVCHSCDNPICVRPDHLFLGTAQDNMRDMCAKGRQVFRPANLRRFGEANPRCKLSDRDVAQILRRLKEGQSVASIARHFGVSKSPISNIKNGHRWVPQSKGG